LVGEVSAAALGWQRAGGVQAGRELLQNPGRTPTR